MNHPQPGFSDVRVKHNIEALASLVSKQPLPEKLKNYSGWGGLEKAIYTPAIYQQIKELLADEDINSIKKTLKTAYYTPSRLVDFIYKAVQQIGCSPKRILEPSAGHGVFIERMPELWRQSASVHAVESDPVSCRLLRVLYPAVEVSATGFESINDNQPYGLIIGNPPYGQQTVVDPVHADLAQFSIHHYFVAKSMRLLEAGGILAMVLPRYFMDSSKKHVRQIIADEGGSLVAAYRLPDDLFDDAKVTVDVVILRKSPSAVNWLDAVKIKQGKQQAFMNQYFMENRSHVLGKIEFIEVYGRSEISCRRECQNIFARLNMLLTQSAGLLSDYQHALETRLKKIIEEIDHLQKEYQQLKQLAADIADSEQKLMARCQQMLRR
ncbi:MAG: Eco57I restriction-modification methylase domain-containing protein [Gammaproteobacteria bacterium]